MCSSGKARVIVLAVVLALLVTPALVSAERQTIYEVTLANVGDNQVLSPAVFATHSRDLSVFQVGEMASEGLRILAEDGMTEPLASNLMSLPGVTDVRTTSSPLPPGESVTISIVATPGDVLFVGAMLMQTNDGFVATNSLALMPSTFDLQTYDAGTETNNQLATHVPGPPFGGAMRAPTNEAIQLHPGLTETVMCDPGSGVSRVPWLRSPLVQPASTLLSSPT